MSKIELRPYQTQIIEEARDAYRGNRGVLVQLPTGGGKTILASSIVHSAANRGNNVWWLTHRRELAKQASDTFYALDIPHGLVQSGNVSDPHARVQVASIQTIVRRLDKVSAPDLIVFDECLAGETLVQTNKGILRIDEINVRAGIKALCEIGGELRYRKITKAWKSGTKKTIKISLSNGETITCTPNHPLFVEGRWTQAGSAKIAQRLATRADFANAAVASKSSETVEAGFENTTLAARKTLVQDWIGRLGLLSQLRTHRSVSADVLRKSKHRSVTLRTCVRIAADHILSFCLGTTRGLRATDSSSITLSNPPSLGRCLEMGRSHTQTSDRKTLDWHGRTASVRRGGSTTKRRLYGDSTPLFGSRQVLDMVKRACGCTRRAYHQFQQYIQLFTMERGNGSLENGLNGSVMSEWRGGFATTGTGLAQCFFTRKVTAKKKTSLSLTGLGKRLLTIIKKVSLISASKSGGPWRLWGKSSHTFPSAWLTKSPSIIGIEAGPEIDVFDITVEEAHNFFANGCLVHNCHHIGAAQWVKIFDAFPAAKILGLTATPWRLDGKGLGTWFTHMVEGPTVRELIDMGSLCDYRLFAPSMPDLAGIKSAAGDYQKGALADAMDKPALVGDSIAHYKRLCAGKRAVVFAAGVANSQSIVAQFNEAGVRAEHVDGSMATEERDAIVERFRSGETLVMSNADLFGEGFDVPAIEAVILLRPTKSLSLYLQQVGRALRPMEGKDRAVILDHAGNSLTHGLPDDEREWSLEDREKRRASEGTDVPVKQCSECFYVYRPAPRCPQCGYAPPVQMRELEQIDGTLEEVARTERIERREKRMEEGRAETLDDFMQIARQRGYKMGWARKRFQIRQMQGRAA